MSKKERENEVENMNINRISIDLREIRITLEKLYGQEFVLDISLSKEQEDEHEGGNL